MQAARLPASQTFGTVFDAGLASVFQTQMKLVAELDGELHDRRHCLRSQVAECILAMLLVDLGRIKADRRKMRSICWVPFVKYASVTTTAERIVVVVQICRPKANEALHPCEASDR